MKLNIDANASRPGGASTKSTRRSRSKLGQAMSEAWGVLGKRKSEPADPAAEALAQARAQEQLARAKGILQLDRTLTAAERAIAEPDPSPASTLIDAWIAAELGGLRQDGALPLDPADFMDVSGVVAATHPSEPLLLVSAEPYAGEPLVGAEDDASERAALEPLPSGELSEGEGQTSAVPLHSAEIATVAGETLATRDASGLPEDDDEPIRTRTMARLLVSHGYLSRALTIYEHLLAEQPDDAGLRAELEDARAALAQKTG